MENEYGSYFACDYNYLRHLRALSRFFLGEQTVLFTTDGNTDKEMTCGTLEGLYATVDFGTSTAWLQLSTWCLPVSHIQMEFSLLVFFFVSLIFSKQRDRSFWTAEAVRTSRAIGQWGLDSLKVWVAWQTGFSQSNIDTESLSKISQNTHLLHWT